MVAHGAIQRLFSYVNSWGYTACTAFIVPATVLVLSLLVAKAFYLTRTTDRLDL